MAKITTKIPKKTDPKPVPSRRISTIQLNKPKATIRNHIPIEPKKINPKPGQLRRNSIGPEKTIGPKPVQPRRYSTGNSSIQAKPTPNYLRASKGSCHDICKYGLLKYEVPMKAKPSKALPRKQSNKTSLKKSSNRENSVENHGTVKTSHENVPEKIIHVIEPNEENESDFPTPSSNEDNIVMITATTDKRDYSCPRKLPFWREKILEMDMEKIKLRRVVCDRKFVHNDDGFTRDVLKRREVKARNSPTGLMNVVIEETATELVQMRKSKMEALVGAFECVINLQDTESSRIINMTL